MSHLLGDALLDATLAHGQLPPQSSGADECFHGALLMLVYVLSSEDQAHPTAFPIIIMSISTSHKLADPPVGAQSAAPRGRGGLLTNQHACPGGSATQPAGTGEAWG